MLYLGTSPCEPSVADMLDARRLGLMCQPASNPPRPGWIWAADNGCFNAKWDHGRWSAWLNRDTPRSGCLFATVPDVVGDHRATLDRFDEYVNDVLAARFPVAFVGQDGAQYGGVPWARFDCLFIGGSTGWKMSQPALDLAREARRRGKWVHVGRVNSLNRFGTWAADADSCDGTFIAFGPKKNAPKVAAWMDRHWAQPPMNFGGVS